MLPVYLNKVSDEFIKRINQNISDMFDMFIVTADGADCYKEMLPIVFPKHYCKNIVKCKGVLYELRDMVLDNYKRNYLKPLYEYILFQMINWWFDVTEENFRDGYITFITNFDGYEFKNEQEQYWINDDIHFYIENMFQDLDFLDLHMFIDVYRLNPDFAENAFGINFSDYTDLLPDDIIKEFDKRMADISNDEKFFEKLLKAIIFACLQLQGNRKFKDAIENERNSFISSILEYYGSREPMFRMSLSHLSGKTEPSFRVESHVWIANSC
ncbi:hypothetical protein Desdi_0625 [Desulfitobacterium dichloroeliminans LMG P-21439]|uniref:Uncharacterized protein n=1 Tax=Desulfitobacterium dichloroeliminans (strain LMG P-21439 / DCA1) TaxID=871963 RepID=L0F546_DESDL|nr:hypothetical protein [Desulfitobacterium dichloroeliminans]AGA68155.1 hypothetical protein Desdi_0625 [Desulfitobacterium dichloroeliminans LMG P-21439]